MFPRQGLFHTFSVSNPTISSYNLGDTSANFGYGVRFRYIPTATTARAQLSYITIENIEVSSGTPKIRGEIYYQNTIGFYIKLAESNWATYNSTRKGLLLDFKNSPTTLITDPEPNTGPIPLWAKDGLGLDQNYLLILRTKTIDPVNYFTIPYTNTTDGNIEDATTATNICNLEFTDFNRVLSDLTLTTLPLVSPMLTFLTEDIIEPTYLPALPFYDIEGQLTDQTRLTLPYLLTDYARIATEGFAIGSSGFVNSSPQKPIIVDPSDTDLIARRFPTSYTSSPVTQLDLAIINPVSYPSTGTISLTCKLKASDYNSVLGEVGIWAKLTYWDSVAVGATANATIGIDVGDYFLLAIAHFPAIVKTNNDALNLNVILAF